MYEGSWVVNKHTWNCIKEVIFRAIPDREDQKNSPETAAEPMMRLTLKEDTNPPTNHCKDNNIWHRWLF